MEAVRFAVKEETPPEGSEVEPRAKKAGGAGGRQTQRRRFQGTGRGPGHLSENRLKYHLSPFFLLQAWTKEVMAGAAAATS